MLFNSLTYLLLLLIVVPLWWVLPQRPRLWLVFVSSFTFYGFWRWDFSALLLLTIATDFFVGIGIERAQQPRMKKLLLCVSLFSNLGILVFFKYFNFITANLNVVGIWLGSSEQIPYFDIILPLGISFYVFQSLSYVIDVYRGFIRAEKDFVLFTDYVIFFPQLVAGPILRATEVVPAVQVRNSWDIRFLAIGFRRILWGLFLKVCLADNLGNWVDYCYTFPADSLSALDVWTTAFLFGFQIYFDFAGYSHIALGSAWLLGIEFPENFDFPYFATSARDFWRRWHISLSSWIRDYIYLPLAGVIVHDTSQGGLASATHGKESGNKTRALFLSWAIMGMWHGANWTFLLWGLSHATFVFVYRISGGIRERLPHAVRSIGGWLTTLLFVMLTWIPFRTKTVSDTLTMWGKVFQPAEYLRRNFAENTYVIVAAILAGMIVVYLAQRFIPREKLNPTLLLLVDSLIYGVVIAAVFIYFRPVKQYIYFQF